MFNISLSWPKRDEWFVAIIFMSNPKINFVSLNSICGLFLLVLCSKRVVPGHSSFPFSAKAIFTSL